MNADSWYRNASWDEEVEAAFEARLARSRSQKAQYLRIQGSLLKDSDPAIAIRLLARCVEEGEPFHIAHAYLDMAHARYVLGDVEGALESLEAAMDQEAREPMFRTSAPYDYAMLVALHDRVERYDRALAVLDRSTGLFFSSQEFQAEGARALIYAAKGRVEDARDAAREALRAADQRVGWVPGYPDVGIVPAVDNQFCRRLRAIA